MNFRIPEPLDFRNFRHLDLRICEVIHMVHVSHTIFLSFPPKGLYSSLLRAIMPDLLVRLNTTAATMSYTVAIGSTGGLFVPLVAFGFDK